MLDNHGEPCNASEHYSQDDCADEQKLKVDTCVFDTYHLNFNFFLSMYFRNLCKRLDALFLFSKTRIIYVMMWKKLRKLWNSTKQRCKCLTTKSV